MTVVDILSPPFVALVDCETRFFLKKEYGKIAQMSIVTKLFFLEMCFLKSSLAFFSIRPILECVRQGSRSHQEYVSKSQNQL